MWYIKPIHCQQLDGKLHMLVKSEMAEGRIDILSEEAILINIGRNRIMYRVFWRNLMKRWKNCIRLVDGMILLLPSIISSWTFITCRMAGSYAASWVEYESSWLVRIKCPCIAFCRWNVILGIMKWRIIYICPYISFHTNLCTKQRWNQWILNPRNHNTLGWPASLPLRSSLSLLSEISCNTDAVLHWVLWKPVYERWWKIMKNCGDHGKCRQKTIVNCARFMV